MAGSTAVILLLLIAGAPAHAPVAMSEGTQTTDFETLLLDYPPDVRSAFSDLFRAYDTLFRLREDANSRFEVYAEILRLGVHLRSQADAWSELPPIHAPPLLIVDFRGADSVHEADTMILVDFGGDDVYYNNAGGSNVHPLNPCQHALTGGVAMLLDLKGDDTYTPRKLCGVNGGAVAGVGFLLDFGGRDVYRAGDIGANGGGVLGGIGALFDLNGDDDYRGGSHGVNGGGSYQGRGLLVDANGNDTYVALGGGVNGGGYEMGAGTLVDLAGDDNYSGDGFGVNGGSYNGVGILFDLSGNDRYSGTVAGANGGGDGDYIYPAVCVGELCPVERRAMLALLVDLGGEDIYYDDREGERRDESSVPKDDRGARVDSDEIGMKG